ncbi:Holliday junction branch migration protein RuvA [Paenibacillus donghaensis]|uniref:Holliday junction branch migration complex subunit RuvA n=1 Tax=Paenibacillus donghaensis TaxID=414771 RepID=A0A2Z2KKA0_9BACL|nr:Holliday junction branch migration protein RuvA [Paenibacillus donghaensis]ASA23713.1 Holliday junction branch migration protein RuvA [Paenibacillus donghaensis]
MIDYLRGTMAHLESEYVVLDVQGVGYRVFCPNPYLFAKVTGEQTIYIHYQSREDATLLFGFPTREEQRLFRKLIEVSGIGPRVALGILTGGTPDQLITAIYQENLTYLTKLPGIGKKTAQRMILDLKDKLDGLSAASMQTGLFAVAAEEDQAAEGLSWQEAREALRALGYTESELDRTWLALKKQGAEAEPVDVLMKKALGLLYLAK